MNLKTQRHPATFFDQDGAADNFLRLWRVIEDKLDSTGYRNHLSGWINRWEADLKSQLSFTPPGLPIAFESFSPNFPPPASGIPSTVASSPTYEQGTLFGPLSAVRSHPSTVAPSPVYELVGTPLLAPVKACSEGTMIHTAKRQKKNDAADVSKQRPRLFLVMGVMC